MITSTWSLFSNFSSLAVAFFVAAMLKRLAKSRTPGALIAGSTACPNATRGVSQAVKSTVASEIVRRLCRSADTGLTNPPPFFLNEHHPHRVVGDGNTGDPSEP